MQKKIDFFENGDYKFILNLIDNKMSILKTCKEFNEKYIKLYDIMEELELTFEEEQKRKFYELIQLFYNTQEYYYALSYSLGVKYGRDLEKL